MPTIMETVACLQMGSFFLVVTHEKNSDQNIKNSYNSYEFCFRNTELIGIDTLATW